MKQRLVHLDMLRGSAALAVCLEHLRAFLFVPFPAVAHPNLLERVFYFFSGLGHQAVMFFFVLSGFLVGGSVIAAQRAKRWSWGGYAIRRLSRLWMVLIPALLLTFFWDRLGQHLAAPGYRGEYQFLYHSGPAPELPVDLSSTTFLGNCLFLQTIDVNCFGSNSPLWSLANEFWYYLLFPLGWLMLAGGTWWRRLACAALVAGLFWWLPGNILLGGVIWLFGAGVYALTRSERGRHWLGHPLWLVGGALATLAMLAVSRLWQIGPVGDVLLGLAAAVLVGGLAVRTCPAGLYSRLSAAASEFSYTLYLVHFPLLACLFFTCYQGRQLAPGPWSALLFAGLLSLVIAYAAAIWWCCERNTDRLRKRLEFALGRRQGGAGSPADQP